VSLSTAKIESGMVIFETFFVNI